MLLAAPLAGGLTCPRMLEVGEVLGAGFGIARRDSGPEEPWLLVGVELLALSHPVPTRRTCASVRS